MGASAGPRVFRYRAPTRFHAIVLRAHVPMLPPMAFPLLFFRFFTFVDLLFKRRSCCDLAPSYIAVFFRFYAPSRVKSVGRELSLLDLLENLNVLDKNTVFHIDLHRVLHAAIFRYFLQRRNVVPILFAFGFYIWITCDTNCDYE